MTKEEALQFQSLQDILAGATLTPLFQPIVSLKKNKIYGYEALIRGPSDSPLHSPINLFDTAAKHGRLAELDLLCREVAIKQYGQLNLKAKLFLNTIPAALLEPEYPHGLTLKFLKQSKLSPEQVVIELTEQYPIDDYELMRDATEHYRDMGFKIALDDLGAGYSGLRTWSELQPNFVKIDRHFMQNIHEDRLKRQFVQSIIDIAQSINCNVIGEGVETRQEYLAAQDMAIDFSQGYYFGRPAHQPEKHIDSELFSKRKTSTIKQTKQRANSFVRNLLTPLNPINVNDTINYVGARFESSNRLVALPVVNNHNVVEGIVWRDEFLNLFASRFGRELHGRKLIKQFMDTNPIIADATLSLKTLSQQITSDDSTQQHNLFVITENEQYQGMGSLMDLLRQITELQITSARHANPLSGLPGNVPISEHIQDAIENQSNAVMCYFDLDNFKPFNDYYGFGKGDKVISKTAKILIDNVDADIDFVGHVGGDDFIILFESHDWLERCTSILAAFTALHPKLYSKQDLANKGITALDRYGNEVFYPLLCLSIGAVPLLDFEQIQTEADLTEYASKAKSAAKKIIGNSIYQLPAEVEVLTGTAN